MTIPILFCDSTPVAAFVGRDAKVNAKLALERATKADVARRLEARKRSEFFYMPTWHVEQVPVETPGDEQ